MESLETKKNADEREEALDFSTFGRNRDRDRDRDRDSDRFDSGIYGDDLEASVDFTF